ncbi:MAG: helix-turn-helix transcriptional regulator [Ignavibacteria bacterium]|nr:helix-turn-helix transcriptional regulator [Ignavibacteria bacterium]
MTLVYIRRTWRRESTQPPQVLPTGKRTEPAPRLSLLPGVFRFLGYNPLLGNASSLGEQIKQYRIQKGLSLRKLAKEMGIDAATLAKWERRKTLPSLSVRNRLTGFFDLLL